MNAQKPVVLACLLLMATLALHGQVKEWGKLPAKAQSVANKSLEQLHRLVTEQNYQRMGFKSMQEVQSASLGLPVQIFKIRLDELQKYTVDINPGILLHGGSEFLYPVVCDKQVRSSVVVADVAGTWKAVAFGNSDSTRIIAATRDHSISQGISTPHFLVQIPALNLSFIAYRVADKLMLIPLFDDLRFNFKANQSLAAEEVFKRILPAAKEHSGLPS